MPPSLKGAIEWMYDYIESKSTLLDFGCATGYFGAYLKQTKGCKVYGVEISQDIIEARKVLDGVYSFDLDGEWPDEVYERTYDYLFFGDVIEHVKDPRIVLKKCKRLLNKNGKIFISTPNIAHISTRLELLGGNFEYESMGILDETHLKYFTRNSLEKIIDDAGYNLDMMDYSSNDYPREVIENLLSKYGLKPTKQFWDMVKTPEARAFQYKMVISLKEASTKVKVVIPEKPEQYRDNFIADLQSQIHNLKNHSDEQAKIMLHLQNETDTLRALVNAPLKSKVKNHFKRKKQSN